MKNYFLLLLLLMAIEGIAQYSNNVWCFGDSAGIRFINGNPINFTTSAKSRGSCVSISDDSDSLLFYSYTRATLPGYTGRIFNSNNILMQNGDSIAGRGWYQEMVIVPAPVDINKFYLFSVLVTSFYGLYYSEIDMSLNNGLGAVIQKNIQLDTLRGTDCLTAVKHGNGRDWWLMFRSEAPTDTNNNFYLYLIDSNGINPSIIKNAGVKCGSNAGSIIFNSVGKQFVRCAPYGLIELFDFDRCTGDIASNTIIENQSPSQNPNNWYWFSAFSANGRYLYVCENDTSSYLHQYDLQATNIPASRITIDSSSYPPYSGGWLKLAPDSNIYWSKCYVDTAWPYPFPYPYPDTVYNMYNSYLSVINDPDSAGIKCNFTPYSFYLGGNRTYWGLPNNPDYDLPGDSACILANLTPGPSPLREGRIQCTYISSWQKLFINAQNLKGKNVTVSIYDAKGRIMFNDKLLVVNGYATRDVDCTGWASGMYVVNLQSEKDKLSSKFIKE